MRNNKYSIDEDGRRIRLNAWGYGYEYETPRYKYGTKNCELKYKTVTVVDDWDENKRDMVQLYGNEILIVPNDKCELKEILEVLKTAVDVADSYVQNSPSGHWEGRAITYITIQPISKELKEKVMEAIRDRKVRSAGNVFAIDRMESIKDLPHRLQLSVMVPSPGTPRNYGIR